MTTLEELANQISALDAPLSAYEVVHFVNIPPQKRLLYGNALESPLDMEWLLIWCDCHEPRLEIRGWPERKSLECFVTHERNPFFDLQCGAFYVFKAGHLINARLTLNTEIGSHDWTADENFLSLRAITKSTVLHLELH